MPIYEDDMSPQEMIRVSMNHICAECGAFLKRSWSNEKDCYALVCERFPEHNGIRRLGRDLEVAEIRNKLKGEPLPMETKVLKKLDPRAMMERVNQARFPKDLTENDRQLIAKISIEYGLDPLFNELMIYQGRPYITIDSRRRKAQETGLLDGISARPATKQERVARRVPDEDYLFIAEVWVKGATHPFEGVGRVFASETKGDVHLPIVKDPAAQCEKRAEAQGLRRAFHIPLPSYEEIIEGEFREITPEKEAVKPKSSTSKAQREPPAPGKGGTLTEPQKRKIWADADKMGYKEDEVHAIAKTEFGVESVNDLSIAQASALIDMIAAGVQPPATEAEES